MTRTDTAAWLPAALAGLCATLIGLGIGRFSYVALLPLLIDAHWATPGGAAQLAAANLIGYMVGALSAHRFALRMGPAQAIRGAMLAICLSLVFCSVNLGIAWLWGWRLLSGIGGGWLMILAAPFIMSRVPPQMRGKAVGTVFSGIGVGVVISGFSVPAVGADHLGAAWLMLAALVAAALAFAWPRFPPSSASAAAPAPTGQLMPKGALLALLLAYMLDGFGYLPHTVFWVEYLVHGLGKPLAIGGMFWAIFGAGAACGPLLTGFAADRFGFRATVSAAFALKAFGVALPLISTSMPSLVLSSFLVGAFTPGLVAVVSGRVLEIAGPAAHQRNWALLTFIYAVWQAIGGYVMAHVYAATHSFDLLFALGTGALSLSALIATFGPAKMRVTVSGQGGV